MKPLPIVVDSLESNSIVLITGTVDEIVSALKTLWASPQTIAKASVSFGFAKIPGAIVSRVEWGFQVGNSFLPEWVSKAVAAEQKVVQTRWQKLMAANDSSYAQVA